MYDPLEEKARLYAKRAVMADRAGNYDEALDNYKKAIELFQHIVRLRTDTPFRGVYIDLINKYSVRIRQLEKMAQALSSMGDRELQAIQSSDINVEVLDLDSPNRPKVTFNDVVGLDEVKRSLKRSVIYPIKAPHLYALGWPKGVLLYGPPGCGKTFIAAALANEAGAVLIKVSGADIMSKWLGEAEKNVVRIFRKAREIVSEGRPVIVFIDEVDGLLRIYSSEVGGEARVKNQFLTEMDGLHDKGGWRQLLFIVGATNKPWLLDVGFLRRFQKRVYVPPPDKTLRAELFKHFIKKVEESGAVKARSDINYDKLAELTENYSSHDIEVVVMETLNRVIEEYFESNRIREITMEDFEETLKEIKPSIDEILISKYREWTKNYASE